MKKKKLYGKTERFKMSKIQVTEKLDGSNLGMFNLNDELIIAQRSSIFKLSDLKEMDKSIMYKGLRKFLEDNGEEILKSLHPNSGFFGE